MDDLAGIADDILGVLKTLGAGKVLALWRNGEFTVEPFAFFGKPRPDGSLDSPVVTFVAGGFGPTRDEVLACLERAVPLLDPDLLG